MKNRRKAGLFQIIDLIGRGDRIRTCDFYVPNVALYQAELHPEVVAYSSGARPIRQGADAEPCADALARLK